MTIGRMADVFEHLRLALPIAGGLVLDLANSYAPIIVAGHYFDAETLARRNVADTFAQ